MGDLKALGSEKLDGMNKIKRILEISRYNENIPNPVNETSKDQYRITLADGNEYQIVKEKTGYIIKRTISESVAEYIDPMKHRKYYPSYSQALKRLNLMAKETNTLYENEEGISLFEQKKFVLKTPKPAAPPPPPADEEVENVPPPPGGDMGAMPPPPPGGDMGAMPPPPGGDMGEMPPPPPEDDMGGMTPMDDTGDTSSDEDSQDEPVTFKTIQKLTGRLGQKLRSMNSDEESQMSSKDIKYVINSILSALNLDELSDDDKDQIISKFEGSEDEFEGSEDQDSETDFQGDEEQDDEMMNNEKEGLSKGEFQESWSDFANELGTKRMAGEMMPGEKTESTDELDMIADSIFKEHKVENLLKKYFVINENEKKENYQKNKKKQILQIKNKKITNREIKKLSESVLQEVSARKLLNVFPDFQLVGKSNKNNLIFENRKMEKLRVLPNGQIR
jgi:hypothetical protein